MCRQSWSLAFLRAAKLLLQVLRCYLWREKTVVPVNPREEEIEGKKCVKSLSDLPDPQDVSVSVVTPPGKSEGEGMTLSLGGAMG